MLLKGVAIERHESNWTETERLNNAFVLELPYFNIVNSDVTILPER